MNIPIDIYNDIISNYLTIYDNKNINKYIENIRQKKIKTSIRKIKKLVCKHLLQRRIDSDINEYYISKIFYKKYYPLNERKFYISLIMQKTNLERHVELMNIIKKYNDDPKNKLSVAFNQIIDLLTDDELFDIGW